jgi:hypothetical protein
MDKKINLHAHKNIARQVIEFYGFINRRDEDGRSHIFVPYLSYPDEEKVEGEAADPVFELDVFQAQTLVNELWDQGIKPEQAKPRSGEIGAVKQHLQDMRAIAFNKLEIDKPEA